jgi:hypothetical protein
MLSPYIIILIIIIVICLYVSEKYENPSLNSLVPGMPSNLNVSNIQTNSITLSWGLPNTPLQDRIKGYILMIRKLNDTTDAFYVKMYENSTCINCNYVFNNIDLDSDTDYVVGVMGFNRAGTGSPVYKTFHSLTTSNSSTPTPTIKSINSSNVLDRNLNNLISRADGIYDYDNSLKYPDTYENDIKQSLKTLNDQVKRDLQEYRINVHLAATK